LFHIEAKQQKSRANELEISEKSEKIAEKRKRTEKLLDQEQI
jgi:hypothetical protein